MYNTLSVPGLKYVASKQQEQLPNFLFFTTEYNYKCNFFIFFRSEDQPIEQPNSKSGTKRKYYTSSQTKSSKIRKTDPLETAILESIEISKQKPERGYLKMKITELFFSVENEGTVVPYQSQLLSELSEPHSSNTCTDIPKIVNHGDIISQAMTTLY